MAEIAVFHHAQGLTRGVQVFADELRAAGHTVHTPDMYEGNTFDSLDDGMGYAREVGFETILERGRQAAEGLPEEIVYAGFSLGLMPAQLLAQTRRGAQGAVLLHGAIPPAEFGEWPHGLRAQIHTARDDDWGDVDVAEELAASVDTVELFVYPGDRHLFTDSSLPDYDEEAASLVKQRVLGFLASLDA